MPDSKSNDLRSSILLGDDQKSRKSSMAPEDSTMNISSISKSPGEYEDSDDDSEDNSEDSSSGEEG